VNPNTPIACFAIRNIVAGVDLSPHSEQVLRHGAFIARRCRSRLTVVHVVLPSLWIAPEGGTALDQPNEMELDENRRKVEEQFATLSASGMLRGVPHEFLIREGDNVAKVLSEVVDEEGADLIVIGTHGTGWWKRFVFGSNAESIIRCAPRPVITIGPSAMSAQEEDSSRVIYATNFGSSSLCALSYALTFARDKQARLTLFHVIEKRVGHGEKSELHKSDCERRLLGLVSGGTNVTSTTEVTVEYGTVGEAIVGVAKRRQANLIVVGASATLMGSLAVTSTLYYVLGCAPCPTLTVHSPTP